MKNLWALRFTCYKGTFSTFFLLRKTARSRSVLRPLFHAKAQRTHKERKESSCSLREIAFAHSLTLCLPKNMSCTHNDLIRFGLGVQRLREPPGGPKGVRSTERSEPRKVATPKGARPNIEKSTLCEIKKGTQF